MSNIPRCNFHIVLIVLGATNKTFAAEKTNIIVKGNNAVKRCSLYRPGTEAEPWKRIAAFLCPPPPG